MISRRLCRTCGESKLLKFFPLRGGGLRRVHCSKCYCKTLKEQHKNLTDEQKLRRQRTLKKWLAENGDNQKYKRMIKYYSNNKVRKKVLTQSQEYYNKYKSIVLKRLKRYRNKLKIGVIAAYGGCCSCCGETEQDFLTVDHINNDGKKHRAAVVSVYRDLRDRGYPPNYTILCFNCNIARSLFGTCPHQR